LIGYKLGHFLDRPLSPALKKIPINPNVLTVLGFVVTTVAASVLTFDLFRGGLLVLAGGFFDMLDGMVARANGKETRWGAYLDSVLDRYSDAFVFLAAAYNLRGQAYGVSLSIATMIGALFVSYARARAEGLGVQCTTGVMERPERIIIFCAGALSGYMIPALWILMPLTHFTVIQRLVYTRRVLRGRSI
jgi:phosphatidylglycerophosphate synthase